MRENTIVYFLGNTMYLNITNICTNKCLFCVRSIRDDVKGSHLWLAKDNVKASDAIEEIKQNSPESCAAIVFCGYGEPLARLEVVKEVSRFIKENYPEIPVRINTNGHANLINKRNIVPELVGLIDKISISLNSDNAKQYAKITCCQYEPEVAYYAVKDFIKECVDSGIDTTASVVVGYKDFNINIENCEKITKELGAKFKVREWLDEGYN